MSVSNRKQRLVQGLDGVKTAAKVLRSGGLAAFPTETVYGLGADATNDTAVAKIYEAKGRPQFNPLIVHAADKEALRSLVEWSTLADALADAFWPGPLTFVLPRTGDCPVSLLASAGLDTLAVRVPSLDLARSLLRACRFPVAAPSANASGHISPTTADHVSREFGSELSVILDGGPSQIGLESTVIDLTTDKPVLLRPGGISRERLESTVGKVGVATLETPLKSPGMLDRHYAPKTPLRLEAKTTEPGEVLLGFGPGAPGSALNLSVTGDLMEAAANLFAMLRDLEQAGPAGIAVMPIPKTGLGVAINDRLRRAATSA